MVRRAPRRQVGLIRSKEMRDFSRRLEERRREDDRHHDGPDRYTVKR